MVSHAYRVELEHCIHMSLCGSCVLDYVNLCERCVHDYLYPCGKRVIWWWWWSVNVMYSTWWLFDNVNTFLYSFDEDLRFVVSIQIIEWEHMWVWYCLRWICVYDVVILILYMRSYFLYVEFISCPTCGKWSPTPLWFRLAGWGCIVALSFSRTAWSLLVFYRFDFGVLSSGTLIRTVGILLCLMFMFEEPWVHFDDVLILRNDVWHLCCRD